MKFDEIISVNEEISVNSPKLVHNQRNMLMQKLSEDEQRRKSIISERFENSITKEKRNSHSKIYPLDNEVKVWSRHSIDQSDHKCKVVWRDLSFNIRKIPVIGKKKQILSNLNGFLNMGQMMAILGPSGAGKSTLLDCICGRKKRGLKGNIKISGVNEVVIGYVPQNDYLLNHLTVKESLMFASQFKSINNNEQNVDHSAIADKIMKRFGLLSVSHTKTQRCSGGQRKRLSIALEVLAQPNILVLDEPTTGLDSPSCAHVISLLLELVSNPKQRMAIVCTIHQPSVKIFNSFHQIYVLSLDGQCIYFGSPLDLMPTLSELNLKCPEFNSPVDYMIEIASGDYGEQPIKKLVVEANEQYLRADTVDAVKPLKSAKTKRQNQFRQQMPVLYKRTQIILYRDLFMTIIRIFMMFFCSIALSLIYGSKGGKPSACLPKELELWATPLNVLSTKFENELFMINQNVCLIFLSLMVGLLTGLAPALLNFPLEMLVFYKEYHNGWYSCISYYVAKVLSDLPLQIICPAIYWGILYTFTGQPLEITRVTNAFLITLLLSFCSQSIGESVSAIWMKKQGIAVFVGLMIPLPMIVFGGFLVKVSKMPFYLQPLSYVSFLRFSFEAMLVSIYGFGRCRYNYEHFLESINVSAVTKPLWAQYLPVLLKFVEKDADAENSVSDIERLYRVFGGNIVKDNRNHLTTSDSLILSFFDINDNYFFRAIAILSLFVVVLKIATYYILLAKLHSQK